MHSLPRPDVPPCARLWRPGTLSSVGVHTDASFPFSPVDGYNKNLTYRSGRRVRCSRIWGRGQAAALRGAWQHTDRQTCRLLKHGGSPSP
jgi:hypothetical protein